MQDCVLVKLNMMILQSKSIVILSYSHGEKPYQISKAFFSYQHRMRILKPYTNLCAPIQLTKKCFENIVNIMMPKKLIRFRYLSYKTYWKKKMKNNIHLMTWKFWWCWKHLYPFHPFFVTPSTSLRGVYTFYSSNILRNNDPN